MAERPEHSACEQCLANEAFRARMLAQCDEIEHYRRVMAHREGRRVSIDQAALEWIERFADAYDEGRYTCLCRAIGQDQGNRR